MALAPLSRIDELTGKLMLMRLEPSHPLQEVQEELRALQRMVRMIQAVLHDAEKREICKQLMKLWLHDLKGIARDAEDVLDEYNYELLRAKVEAGIQTDEAAMYHRPCKWKCGPEVSESAITSIPLNASFCGKIANKIRKVRQRFDEISKDCVSLRLEEKIRRPSPAMTYRRQSSHIVDAPRIHGRRDDVEKVIAQLLHSEECKKSNLSVVPIVGMGGVGKTTLVQHVYNDQRICGHFQMMGWVCVSDDFRIVELTKRIIESLVKVECHLKDMSVLHERLKAGLEGNRFLLVLDDVWNEDQSIWESLQKPLWFGAQGSAVISTTRSGIVATG